MTVGRCRRNEEEPTTARPTDRTAFDWQVVDAYLAGLESELETKLRDMRRMRQAVAGLAADGDATARVQSVRAWRLTGRALGGTHGAIHRYLVKSLSNR